MTRSLRLSVLLLLLLSRWAYADLEKGEDEYVRSWVIIEEQLVPPSRDELLTVGGSVSGAGRRITPKSVFVAPSFNKCSDGYRPDSMGRCVKVVKLNQAAQWDFLLKQLNSMYGAGAAGGGGGFPIPTSSAFQPSVMMTTTTVEPPLQKTDSPGPFQLNIPLADGMDLSNQTMESVDDQFITSTSAGSTIIDDESVIINHASTIINITADNMNVYPDDHTTLASTTVTGVTTDIRQRPYRNRYQTQTEDNTVTVTPIYDSQTYSTIIATDEKTKYVSNINTSTVETENLPQTTKNPITSISSSTSPANVVTTTSVGVTESEEQMTTTVTTSMTREVEEENVVTVLAVAAVADVSDGVGPSSLTRLPSMTTRVPYTTNSSGISQHQSTDIITPEYYDDQSEEPTLASELDCSASNAYLYYPACASLRQQQQLQQQQLQQLQQKQLLLQQQQQLYQHQQQQQQQQFYHQQQLVQQNQMTTTLVKRPISGGGVQVRFPEEDPTSAAAMATAVATENVNLVRFPSLAPYRTTNKMYESSRHPTWWPTGWSEQQQQSDDTVHRQYQQHRIQHYIPQQKQDIRHWEFGSRLPKITTTTTIVPPSPSPTQWFRRFF